MTGRIKCWEGSFSLFGESFEMFETKTARIGNEYLSPPVTAIAGEFSTEFAAASDDLDPDTMYELEGKRLIGSLSTYIMHVDRAIEWVSHSGKERLCVKTTSKPAMLKFWVTRKIAASYLTTK